MASSSSRGKLVEVFKQALNLKPDVDVENLTYNSIKAWDSVAHMVLVAAIETEFDIMLETDDVLEMSSFSKAMSIVEKYGIEFAA